MKRCKIDEIFTGIYIVITISNVLLAQNSHNLDKVFCYLLISGNNGQNIPFGNLYKLFIKNKKIGNLINYLCRESLPLGG